MNDDMPNWMKVKAESQSIKPKKARAASKRAPKPPKEPKLPRPAWTVVEKIYESKARNPRLRRGVICHLRYKGRRVHTVTGATAKQNLQAKADEWNKSGYSPEMTTVKLYCEMSDEDKLKLAHQSSPDLFS